MVSKLHPINALFVKKKTVRQKEKTFWLNNSF